MIIDVLFIIFLVIAVVKRLPAGTDRRRVSLPGLHHRPGSGTQTVSLRGGIYQPNGGSL